MLHTERLVLRGPEPRDAEPFLAFFTGPRAAASGNGMARPEAWRLLAATIGHWTLRGFGMWTLVPRGTDEPVGLVGGLRFEDWPEPEVAWFLWDGHEGRGLAFEAARAALAHAFGAWGWATAVSYVESGNRRSVRLAERLGAKRDLTAPRHPAAPQAEVWRHRPLGALG